jgi:hypothetical protein
MNVRFALLALAGAATAVATAGCISDKEMGNGTPACPPLEDFRAVNNVLERRCGMLDCHGNIARPFIVYSQTGLRRLPPSEDVQDEDEYVTGGLEPTSDGEVLGTWQSACYLEPEKMDSVLKGDLEVTDLTLVRKPRLEEKHKGGRIWNARTQKGDKCLLSWIAGDVDLEACELELELP